MAFFGFVGAGKRSPLAPKIRERIADLAKRSGDLTPLREPVRKILWEGNRSRALRGVDWQGQPFAPLAASTLARRDGDGPPLAPHRAASRIVTGYVVNVIAGSGKLSFTGAWPGVDFVEYFVTGTKWMPKRDPLGFDDASLGRVHDLLKNYVRTGRVG